MAQLSDQQVLDMNNQNQSRMTNIETAQNQIRDIQHNMLQAQTTHAVQVTRIEENVKYIAEALKKREESDVRREEDRKQKEGEQDKAIDDLQSSRDKQRGIAAAIGFIGSGLGMLVGSLGKKLFGL